MCDLPGHGDVDSEVPHQAAEWEPENGDEEADDELAREEIGVRWWNQVLELHWVDQEENGPNQPDHEEDKRDEQHLLVLFLPYTMFETFTRDIIGAMLERQRSNVVGKLVVGPTTISKL